MTRLLMLLGVLATLVVAAPAYADPTTTETAPNNDADFLQQLTDAGLTFHDGQQAIAAAKNVCQLADEKTPEGDIEKNLQSGNPSLAGTGAERFMILAASEYCPRHLDES